MELKDNILWVKYEQEKPIGEINWWYNVVWIR